MLRPVVNRVTHLATIATLLIVTGCAGARPLDSVSCEMIQRAKVFLADLQPLEPPLSIDNALDPHNDSPQEPFFIREERADASSPFRIRLGDEPRIYRHRLADGQGDLVEQNIWLGWSIDSSTISPDSMRATLISDGYREYQNDQTQIAPSWTKKDGLEVFVFPQDDQTWILVLGLYSEPEPVPSDAPKGSWDVALAEALRNCDNS